MDLKELVDDYLEGKLSPKDRKLFEDLIAQNPRYRTELEQQEKGKAAAMLVEKRSHRRLANLKSWLFPAAIASFIVLFGYLLWITLGMSPGEKLYAKYYQTLPNQITETMLGSTETKLKMEAFQAYEAGDFKRAATLFDKIPFESDSDYLLLYQGICQLELGRPEKAIPLFNLVRPGSSTASREVASWFAALGYFKLNMLERGEKSLRITASNANPYQEEAKIILETLH